MDFFYIWDSMLRRYPAHLVPLALRIKGAYIDGSLRKGVARDLTLRSTPASFSFLRCAVFLPICFTVVTLRTNFHFREMPPKKWVKF